MQSLDMTIAVLVLLIESGLIIALIIGWYFGARRLNINLHHGVVYGGLLINTVIVAVWMLPRGIRALPYLLTDPLLYSRVLLHFMIGLVVICLGLVIGILFLLNRDIPLGLLKKAQPFMIVILLGWIITFSLGALNFILSYVF